MDMTNLTNQELEQNVFKAVINERKSTYVVILHLAEINRRKLFLLQGYSSLYDYLIRKMKYSSSAAQRRIEALRLIQEVPKVAGKLATGEMNLSQVGEIQRAVKQSEKFHQVKVSQTKKLELVDRVLQVQQSRKASVDQPPLDQSASALLSREDAFKTPATTAETQKICAEALEIPIMKVQKIVTQKDGSRMVQVTFAEEQWEKFEAVRNLVAHDNLQKKRTQSLPDVLETAFERILKSLHITPKAKTADRSRINSGGEGNTLVASKKVNRSAAPAHAVEPSGSVEVTAAPAHAVEPSGSVEVTAAPASSFVIGSENSTANLKAQAWKSLTPKRKRNILAEEKCCQYENPQTGQRCGSRFNLHVDHIIPRALGGSHSPSNLRALCREHNLFRARDSRRS